MRSAQPRVPFGDTESAAALERELAGQPAHEPFGSIDIRVHRAVLEPGCPRFAPEPNKVLLEFVTLPIAGTAAADTVATNPSGYPLTASTAITACELILQLL